MPPAPRSRPPARAPASQIGPTAPGRFLRPPVRAGIQIGPGARGSSGREWAARVNALAVGQTATDTMAATASTITTASPSR
jgi:hypothetical protein